MVPVVVAGVALIVAGGVLGVDALAAHPASDTSSRSSASGTSSQSSASGTSSKSSASGTSNTSSASGTSNTSSASGTTASDASASTKAAHASSSDVASSSTDPLVARGAYLAKAGDCAGCHTAPSGGKTFAGGLGMGSPFGTIYSANITPDPDTGIGRYSFADFDKVLRDGVAPGGKRLYPAMPYASYTKITDDDMHALYAYFMHGVTPVHHVPPTTHLPFPFSWRPGLFFWDVMFVRHDRFKPTPSEDTKWNRGAYLVQTLGHCGACHTPRGPAYEERGYDQSSRLYLTGATNDHWFAPNLTGDPASGLGRMSEDDIARFLHEGHGARGATFGSMVQVVEDSTQYMNEDDLHAIAHYLKSLPAQQSYGAYHPDSKGAAQSVAALHTGETERPGAGIYMSFCARCHGVDGRGKALKYPALAGNAAVLSPDATSLMRLVVEGGNSPSTVPGPKREKMPSFAGHLTDVEIAQVLTFVRTTWGNVARPVTTRDVRKLRDAIHK